MMGNYHVPCGAGEKLEITSNAYLLRTRVVEQAVIVAAFLIALNGQFSSIKTSDKIAINAKFKGCCYIGTSENI